MSHSLFQSNPSKAMKSSLPTCLICTLPAWKIKKALSFTGVYTCKKFHGQESDPNYQDSTCLIYIYVYNDIATCSRVY